MNRKRFLKLAAFLPVLPLLGFAKIPQQSAYIKVWPTGIGSIPIEAEIFPNYIARKSLVNKCFARLQRIMVSRYNKTGFCGVYIIGEKSWNFLVLGNEPTVSFCGPWINGQVQKPELPPHLV